MYKRNDIASLSLNMAYPESHGFMFQQLHDDDGHHHHHLQSPTSLPSCPPQLFHGEGGNFMMMNRSMSFSGADKITNNNNNHDEAEEDLSDDGSQLLGEKKKRLNLEQVRALEKSFELGNKLEPERKLQLAKALGLQPRQIAIWFQNRRARWKTKQLEKDYEVLKKQFEVLKADNNALHEHNKNLNAELVALRTRDCNDVPNNIKRETEVSWSNNCSDNSTSDKNLDMSRTPISIIKDLFPSSMRQTQMDHHHNQHQHQQQQQMVQEESFCNMFNGIDEQHNFWPWPDHNQHQNFN